MLEQSWSDDFASATRAYVGLGSNLGDPLQQVTAALMALEAIPATRCVRHSALYRSAAMGPQPQPPYINAVAALDTLLSPYRLLAELQLIEARHGRVRGPERWQARTLDLDLLLYGEERIASDSLTVPHPGLGERDFVLYPLYELAPQLHAPGIGPLVDLLPHCARPGLERVTPA